MRIGPAEYGERVKQRRLALGWDRRKLARIAFVEDDVIRTVENGTVTSLVAVRMIEAAFRAAKVVKK